MANELSSVARPGELSPMQRAFARAYVMNGGKAEMAAREAGYSEGSVEQIALRNVRHKLVIAEIKRLSVVEVGAKLPELIQKLFDMVADNKTPPDVKARIIFNLMDRGGMHKQAAGPAVQVNVQVNGQGSSALIAEIWDSKAARERALAAPLSGIDGSMTDVVGAIDATTFDATNEVADSADQAEGDG